MFVRERVHHFFLAGSLLFTAGAANAGDPHSYSRLDQVRVTHIDLEITPSFSDKKLLARARLSIERVDTSAPLILDRQGYEVESVTTGKGPLSESAEYNIEKGDAVRGEPLVITLPDDCEWVEVSYRTLPSASALQWLTPKQAGSAFPFLYTQSQPIHARTWIPCQDTPSARVTYSALVHAPKGTRAVMSASKTSRDEEEKQEVFRFEMEQPIPSYLIALAVGELAFGDLGERTGVWAKPSILKDALHEFADTEAMIQAAERLWGPYRFGRYDLLVLPPSFPFGGMENAKLSFITPTILAGDRSLVSLIAHELAHSWSGNLVTNATWCDFWLNEGFTVYLERRLIEELFGRERSELEASLGRGDLEADLKALAKEPELTALHVDLEGRDPDDAFSDVPYEKGYLFLRLLEETLGRDAIDHYLKGYFDRFAFKSVGNETLLTDMRQHLFPGHEDIEAKLLFDAWLNAPGLPRNTPKAQSSAMGLAEHKAKSVALEEGPIDTEDFKSWSTHEWLGFLRALPRTLSLERMRALDETFEFTESRNSEIRCEWLLLTIATRYEKAFDSLRQFLKTQGRRKFLEPLYQALAQEDDDELARFARQIYDEARDLYHPISQTTIDQILGGPH